MGSGDISNESDIWYTNQMKKLVIATGIFPPDIGGPATYSQLLLRRLPAYGYEISIVTYGETQAQDNPAVIRVSRKWPKGIRHLLYGWNVWRIARRADAVFIQGVGGEGIPAMWAARCARKPILLKIVGDYAWEQATQRCGVTESIDAFQIKRYTGWPKRWQNAQRKVAESAQWIITPSEYLRKLVSGWGISEEKIRVVPNAVAVSKIPCRKEEARAECGIDGIVLVSIGRLVPWKGFSALIETIAGLRVELPAIQLVIIGDGPERKMLEQKIKTLNLENQVRLIGAVPKEIVQRYLCAADLFVLNTGYEGFSHQIIEAMAAGVPVLTTRSGGNPEIIDHGHNGWLVEYNDQLELQAAIRKLCMDSNTRTFLSKAGQETATQFSEERMLSLLRVIMDRVCES